MDTVVVYCICVYLPSFYLLDILLQPRHERKVIVLFTSSLYIRNQYIRYTFAI